MRAVLVARIAEIADINSTDVTGDRPLSGFGLSSRDAVTLAAELGNLLGKPVPVTAFWEFPTLNQLVGGLLAVAPETVTPQREVRDEPIAVVGLGCRLPGGVHGPAGFWDLLRNERDAVTEVPPGRWEQFGPVPAGVTRHGGFLDDVAGFDADFFGITPGEAELMDPQQRLLLEVAREALDHAAIAAKSLAGTRTGVFAGVSGSEYAHLTTADPAAVQAWTATGAAGSIVANRLSYLLDLRGPSLTVDTACSSSLVAVHLAIGSLRSGESDVALAGGVNLLLSPIVTQAFDQAGGTSPDGRCRAFAAAANGMVRGEGCGVVVLKRLGDARRDGDAVLAVIRGSAVNSDGRSNGMVAPNLAAQRAVLAQACADAGVAPGDVGYVETHGTGTPLGDPVEAAALAETLGAGRPSWRPLLIGSVKTNVGHLEAAAGVTGLIKTVLALRHGFVPASLHFDEPNPHIDFAAARLRVAAAGTSWPRSPGGGRYAGVSSFGFGGTNAHVVLEASGEAPAAPDSVALRHFLLSGTDHAAAVAAVAGSVDPADLAYTLARRGTRTDDRIVVVARDNELRDRLDAAAQGRTAAGVVTGSGSAAAQVWVFSGYQPNWRPVPELMSEPGFAAAVAALDEVIAAECGLSLRAAVLGEFTPRGPWQVMPLTFGLQLALAGLWRAHGVTPSAVIGHSVGEVAAVVAAGGLSVEDGVLVVTRRSALLARLVGRGAMAVLGVPGEEVADVPGVHVAVFAAPDQCVVTGDRDQVAALAADVERRGLFAKVTDAEGAGHSPQVDALLPELRAELAGLTPNEPLVPVYSTSAAGPLVFDAGYWAGNVREPVRFVHAVRAAAADGHRCFTEISAHPVLGHPIKSTVDNAVVTHTLRRDLDPELGFHTALATLEAHGRPVRQGSGRVVDVPLPAWRHRRHWVRTVRDGRTPDELLGLHTELPDRHTWHHTATVDLPVERIARMARAAGAIAQETTPDAIAVRGLWRAPGTPGPVTSVVDDDGQFTMHTKTAGEWRLVASAEVVAGDGAMPVPVRDKLFEMRWHPAPLPERSEPGRWLLLGDSDRLAAHLGDEIAHRLDESVTGVVLVLNRSELPAPEQAEQHVLTIVNALRLVADLAAPPRLWVAGTTALSGAVRVLALEHPQVRVTLIDGDAHEVAAELRAGLPADQVRWREGVRCHAQLTRAELPEQTEPVVRADNAYVISGGLSGLGLVTARWLAESGAARLVLNGRRNPTSETEDLLTAWRAAGCDVVVVTGDIADETVAGRLVEAAQRDGLRLGGVVHAAGVLADRLATEVDEDNLHEVWSAKAHGAWRLHLATLHCGLDWFVVYSSAAALLGSPGQLAYATANAWLDALMRWRRDNGLPGTSIGWGTWAETGGVSDTNRVGVLRPIVPAEGVEALESVLTAGGPSVGVFDLRANLVAEFPELATVPYFGEFAAPCAPRTTGGWSSAIEVSAQVRSRVTALVGHELDPHVPLLQAGIDYLVVMRMKTVLEHDFGVTVPAALVLRGASLSGVETHVVTALGLTLAPTTTSQRIGARDAAERFVLRAFRALETDIDIHDDFFTHGANEAHVRQVLADLDVHVDQAITEAELRANPTAERLAALVRARQRNTGLLRTLRMGSGRPLYLAHPAGGDTAVYRELVSLLSPHSPVYGLDRVDDVHPVTDRALRYADLIETPAVLGGWSFGGVLAFETARVLHAKGTPPDLVVMLDSGLPLPLDEGDTEESSLTRRLMRFSRYLTETYGRTIAFDEVRLRGLDDEGQLAVVVETMRAAGLEEQLNPEIMRHQITSHVDTRALERYRAGSYPGRVVLFRATEPTPWTVEEPRFLRTDESLGWAEHCPDLTVIPVPGHHLSLLDPPGVQVIAEEIERLIR